MNKNKVFYFNFNVGSGIEKCGDTIKPWIEDFCKDNDYKFFEHKSQGQGYEQFDSLIKENPDVIILNEYYDKSVEASLFFKILYPNTSLILISHVHRDLDWACGPDDDNDPKLLEKIRFKKFLEFCDSIFIVNKKPNDNFPSLIKNKVHNLYQPTNPAEFAITAAWENRTKDFLYLGNMLPHKLGAKFVEKVDDYDIVLDCVGSKDHTSEEFSNLIESKNNLVWLNKVEQSEVPSVMNEYKYFILPHDGPEPFNMALLQSMFCGMVPLIVNYCENEEDCKWLRWAKGLYFEFNSYEDLLQTMNDIKSFEENYNMEKISKNIRNDAKNRFSYEKFKNIFISILKKLTKVEN